MIRRTIALLLSLCMILTITACNVPVTINTSGGDSAGTFERAINGNAEHVISKDEFPFYIATEKEDRNVTLYFLDGVKDLPYIEVDDWRDLLNYINTEGGEQPGYEITVTKDGSVVTYTRETGYSMVMDFDRNTFSYMDYNLFMKLPDMSTLLDFTSRRCFNDKGEPSLMKKTDEYSYDRYGDELVLKLGEYGIDIICQDGLFLVPLQTMCDFTLAPARGLNCFYNGECLIMNSGITAEDKNYYSAPTGTRSEELTNYGYNELCLMLDSLYGLKDAHEIRNFDKLFEEVGFKEILLNPDPVRADKAIYYLLNKYIDDLHSSFTGYSYLTGPIDYQAERGPSFTSLIEHLEENAAACKEQYPDGIPQYEEVGNTAYITFNEFVIGSSQYEDYYGYDKPEDIPIDDTIAMVIKAHEKITRKDSPIENVVIDLSCNIGGSVDTAAFLIAWCLGKASISLKDNFTGAMSNTEYWADVNLDRKFDEKDTIADKNLYCLISPVSFSCGNLVPNVFKQSGRVTLLGRTSGGGSCVVQPISSAWGTSFNISAQRRMSFMKNGSLYDIDRGADPDYTISDPAKYYDRKSLTEYINSLY